MPDLTSRTLRSAFAVLTLSTSPACVLPAYDVSGVELSWRFVEAHPVPDAEPEGESADQEDGGAPVRTCKGSGFDQLAFFIDDTSADDRRGSFIFDCEDGFQTADQVAAEQSAAFVELRGGTYQVDVLGQIGVGPGIPLGTREVAISGNAPTVYEFKLTRPPVVLPLELANVEQCESLTLALFYADPANHLADPDLNEMGNPLPMLYRETLVTDRGLSLSGVPTPCTAELAGPHAVPQFDPGSYRLEITRDAVFCSVLLTIGETPSPVVVDVANLAGCQG